MIQTNILLLLRSPSLVPEYFWQFALYFFEYSPLQRLQLASMLTAADQMVDGSPDSSFGGTSLYAELAIWLIQNWNLEEQNKLLVYLSCSHVNADVVGISENECSPYIDESNVAHFLVNVLNEAPASKDLQNILKTILMKHKSGLVCVTEYFGGNVPQQSIAAAQEYIHRVSNSTHAHPGIQLPNLN